LYFIFLLPSASTKREREEEKKERKRERRKEGREEGRKERKKKRTEERERKKITRNSSQIFWKEVLLPRNLFVQMGVSYYLIKV